MHSHFLLFSPRWHFRAWLRSNTSSHTPSEDRQARLAGAGRRYHGAERPCFTQNARLQSSNTKTPKHLAAFIQPLRTYPCQRRKEDKQSPREDPQTSYRAQFRSRVLRHSRRIPNRKHHIRISSRHSPPFSSQISDLRFSFYTNSNAHHCFYYYDRKTMATFAHICFL